MKKQVALLLSFLLLMACALPGLAEADVIYINPEFNEKEMKNIQGETILLEEHMENLVGYLDLGFAFIVPDYMNGWDETSPWQIDDSMHSIGYVYFPKELMPTFLSLDTLTDEKEMEEAAGKISEGVVYTFGVLRVNPQLELSDASFEAYQELYEHMEEFTKNGDDTIYLCYNTTFKSEMLTAEEQETLAKFVEEGLQIVKSTLILFPPVYQEAADPGQITVEGGAAAFAVNDLDGNPFDTGTFSKYDLTVVNVWYTWCGPCVAEMPDLQKLKEQLPENVNLITVCMDGESENELAKEIVASVDATFQTLQGDSLAQTVMANIYAVPTNLFMDKDGLLVGDPVVGAMGAGATFVEDALKIVSERLAFIGK